MKKRKVKNEVKIIFTLLLLIIGVSVAILYLKKDNDLNIYKEKGYTKEQINQIMKMDERNQKVFADEKYNLNLFDILENKDYQKKYLKEYLAFMEKYNAKSDETIFLVNLGIETYSKDIMALASEKYFIKDNLERYLNYKNNNDKLNANQIIKDVNSFLDYDYYSLEQKTDLSKNELVIVNKYNSLDDDYKPDNLKLVLPKDGGGSNTYLQDIAVDSYIELYNAIENLGMHIQITTSYRSYSFQNTLYTNYVKADGVALADTYSARPGYSEHQTGLAVDLKTATNKGFGDFGETPEFEFLKDNSYKYGWILRYPENEEKTTGYKYEPWHYRFVGKDVAKYIYENNLTYEEYYAYFVK